MILLRYAVKILKEIYFRLFFIFCWLITYIKLKNNGVRFSSTFRAMGIPVINVNLKGSFKIGDKFFLNSGKYYNMIGRQQPCYFIVGKNAELSIGNNVGISCAAIICYHKISIGNNVRIGGNVVIYDTDFHSLNVLERIASPEITDNVKTAAVEIQDGAFIGAHVTILKGVTIGKNAIIGAGAVVVKSIPDNQIWAGNPAKFIKYLA